MRPSRLPALVLVLWLTATLLWWGFAFMPMSAAPPEWLTAARAVCFGSVESGLPAPYGWMLLVLGPASFLVGIFVIWGSELGASVVSLARSPVGACALAVIAAGLVVGSIVFVAAEAIARQRRLMTEVGVVDAVIIGIAQAIALIPGISRSGITISAGLARELRREDATRFAFLLATPVIIGAGAKTLLDARKAAELFAQPDVLGVGFVLSFLSGLAAVAFMVRFLRGHSLNWFVAYRLVLAAVIVVLVVAGVL